MAKNERPVSWLWKVMLVAGLGTVAVWAVKRHRVSLREGGRNVAAWASDKTEKATGMLREKRQAVKSTAQKEFAAHPTVQSASDLINKAGQAITRSDEMVTEYARELKPGLRITPMTYRRIKRKPLQRKD